MVLDCTSKKLLFAHSTVTLTESQVWYIIDVVYHSGHCNAPQFLEGLVIAENKLVELDEMYRTIMTAKLSCLMR